MRALTFVWNDVPEWVALCFRGNYVDVLCPNKETKAVELVLQDVKVLAVDQRRVQIRTSQLS
jgi:Flp pilus assembly protein CpaB